MEEARILADVLYKRDPFRVKHRRKVWGKVDPPSGYFGWRGLSSRDAYFVLDTEPEFMSLEDQLEEAATRISQLGLFQFLCRPAIREGEVSHSVIPVSIANLDRDDETGSYQFPDSDRVARFRAALESHAGIPAATILKELDSSLPARRAEQDGHSPRLKERQPPQRRHEGNQHNGTDAQSAETPRTAPAPVTSDATPANSNTQTEHRHQRRHRLS
jgi:hypothetical protein